MPSEEMMRGPAAQLPSQVVLAEIVSMTTDHWLTGISCSSTACDDRTAAHLVGQLGLLGVVCSPIAHDVIALAADDLAAKPCNSICAGHEVICVVCHQQHCEELE